VCIIEAHPVLGEVSAELRVRFDQVPVAFVPTARHIERLEYVPRECIHGGGIGLYSYFLSGYISLRSVLRGQRCLRLCSSGCGVIWRLSSEPSRRA
jgi:hypothetical protein